MSELLTQANTFKRALLRGDADALRRLSAAYALSEAYLRSQLENLLREVERQRAAGQTISRAWLLRQARFQILLRQVEAEQARLSSNANALIIARQQELVGLASSHAEALLRTAGVGASFVRLPTEAIEEIVGNLSDGTPLTRLLDKLGPEAAREVREALVTGLVAGEGPRAVARRFREALGGSQARALLIARTETIRAYRNSTQRIYEANADVLAGWMWLSARSSRTCVVCWAKDGEVFPVEKPMPAHVSCRCTMIPLTDKTQAVGLGSGPGLFAEMDEGAQERILGPTRFEAFKAGAGLSEFVTLERSRRWGDSYAVRPAGRIRRRAAWNSIP
jgi:SPP1 gp7 family putative phage head morphogenesis protein